MQDGFSVLDANGVQSEVNPAFCEMTGFAREELIGLGPSYRYWPPEECAMENIQAALAGRPQFFEWMHRGLGGTPFPAEVTLNTVTLGGNAMPQAIVRDISRRRQAEDQIRELAANLDRRVEQRTAELKAANKELEASAHSISQDLRAPLRAVDGFSRIVVKKYAERLDDEGRKKLEMISGGAVQMAQLIGDLLASRIGRQTLAPGPALRSSSASSSEMAETSGPKAKLARAPRFALRSVMRNNERPPHQKANFFTPFQISAHCSGASGSRSSNAFFHPSFSATCAGKDHADFSAV